jgi:hypothetical protein
MEVFQQDRYGRLKWPIHKIQAQTPEELFQALPSLRRYFQRLEEVEMDVDEPEMDGEGFVIKQKRMKVITASPIDLVRIVKYIVFVYDQDSDLDQEYADDYRLLKDAAAKDAGFKRKSDGNWPDYVEEIMNLENEKVTWWIVDYLKVSKNAIWTELRMVQEELDLLYRDRVASMIKGKVKEELKRIIDSRLESKEQLVKKFYAQHSELKGKTEKEIFPISPENVFKELNIPEHLQRVLQIKDVPPRERWHEPGDPEPVSGVAAPDAEADTDPQ